MLEGDWKLTLFKSSNELRVSLEISKSAGARIAGNSAANDEGRALAARRRAEKCHGRFNTAVSHLLISGSNELRLEHGGLRSKVFFHHDFL
jgi:hypothetical protein